MTSAGIILLRKLPPQQHQGEGGAVPSISVISGRYGCVRLHGNKLIDHGRYRARVKLQEDLLQTVQADNLYLTSCVGLEGRTVPDYKRSLR
ncbi:hypothetical protein GOODEAATRI_020099 [Goodea atripinnis]|uniref:Uncharacterized protein n=1 Tax=Goodea atripinnis TaxID=208336 RepID=A0ABV0NW60_9TELE